MLSLTCIISLNKKKHFNEDLTEKKVLMRSSTKEKRKEKKGITCITLFSYIEMEVIFWYESIVKSSEIPVAILFIMTKKLSNRLAMFLLQWWV